MKASKSYSTSPQFDRYSIQKYTPYVIPWSDSSSHCNTVVLKAIVRRGTLLQMNPAWVHYDKKLLLGFLASLATDLQYLFKKDVQKKLFKQRREQY